MKKTPERWTASSRILLVGLGAVALRLALFSGRGDYIAFDEGWYLLLGQNLLRGDGYTLSGLTHVALSPLFPVLAGVLEPIVGDIVWAGRLVAAITAGLLVIPCWFIFGRLAGERAAFVGSLFVASLPSLAPFVAPFWIGWDLWVGAEPLLHLFLFTGIALFVRTWETNSLLAALGCGAAFALAYLARPEAIIAFGLLGLAAVLLSYRMLRTRALRIVLCVVAFAVVAAPYWMYLEDSLGRWAITGRGVQVIPQQNPAGARRVGSNRIETMLWQGDASAYVQRLYTLNRSGTALADNYWGIPLDEPDSAALGSGRVPAAERGPDASSEPTSAGPQRTRPDRVDTTHTLDGLLRYTHAMGIVVPWYVWLFTGVGLFAGVGPLARVGRSRRDDAAAATPPRRLDLEALVALPLVGTSIAIALVVATDPRTQLFVAPLACYYAALGTLVVAGALKARMGREMRSRVAAGIVVGALALIMLGTHARRLYLSLSLGSPHHVVGAENAMVGEALREALPPDATVMSWHPAIALFADRDWRVLPLEPMERIVRYART